MAEVDPDAALVAAEMLDEEVAARCARDESGGDETADGIAVARVLDLHHLGTPVAQYGGGRGDEAPVGHFDDADTCEDVGHRLVVAAQLRP